MFRGFLCLKRYEWFCPIKPCSIVCKLIIKVTVKFIYHYQKNVTTLSLQLLKQSNAVTSKVNKKVTYNCNFITSNELLPLNIRCTTLLPPFFFRNSKLYWKNWLYIYIFSKYCPLLATTFSHLSGSESRVEKTGHLLRLSTNRSTNFLLLHKTGSAGQPGRVPLIETSDSQREQRLENTAGGLGFPISTFPSMSWLSQHGVEHAAKSLYRVSRCIAASYLSMLGSNASIAFDTDRLWLFQSVLTVHNTLRRASPTKYRAWPWSREYIPVNIRFGRRRGSMAGNSPWFSALGIIVMNPFFKSPVTMRCRNPFRLCLSSSCSQANKRRSTSLGFNSYGTQFSCFWIIPMTLRRFEMACWVTLNDRANSSWFWDESCSSNAFNFAS